MGIEQGRRASSKSGKPKKIPSGVISGAIGGILKDGRDVVGKEREKPVVDGASQIINVIYKCNL